MGGGRGGGVGKGFVIIFKNVLNSFVTKSFFLKQMYLEHGRIYNESVYWEVKLHIPRIFDFLIPVFNQIKDESPLEKFPNYRTHTISMVCEDLLHLHCVKYTRMRVFSDLPCIKQCLQ